jgi:photosynthetic reaction center cytochrome c subunit
MTHASGRIAPGRIGTRGALVLVTGLLTLGLAGCHDELGQKQTTTRGYRGTGMDNIYDKSELERKASAVAAAIPATLPPSPAPTAGPLPWRNVQVLNDISGAEFVRTMLAMSTWVAGTGNCAYCHNVAAPWDDTLANGKPIYTKLVARRMLQMVRNINGNYAGHVANTGVTCYTCHLGKPLPNGLWFYNGPNQVERYFLDRDAVRVQTHQVAASNGNRSSVKQTEWTYGVMIKLSSSLGVSCSHCHNSRAFWSWEQAPPQRAVAFLAAGMVRDLNQHYLAPLQPVFPASRLGAMGDAPKLQCVTCHNGAYKPLYAYPMAKDYPALWGRAEWNGVPFPAIPTAEQAAAAAAQAKADSIAAAKAATAAPASAPVSTPASSPATAGESATGAMGGNGPAGKDTTGKNKP